MHLNIFDFTETDLKSNQQGFISTTQKQWLNGFANGIRKSQWTNAKIGMIFPFLGLGILALLFLSAEGAREALFANPINLICLVAIFPVVAGIFVISIFFANRRADALTQADLQKVEGTIRCDEEYARNVGTVYYVYIANQKFAFSEKINKIFVDGKTYRIFFCEAASMKLIFSYEQIA